MKERIVSRIENLRRRMKQAGADLCLITGEDYHLSEYPGKYFGTREFFSGFTGSAGVLLISREEVWFFTDGRYFTQAEYELEGTGISLMKSGTKGVPTVKEHIEVLSRSKKYFVIAFDGRTVSAHTGCSIAEIPDVRVIPDFDPVGDMWGDRPAFPCSESFVLDLKYAGETAVSKLTRIKESMMEAGAEIHVIASLDDTAWTLNMRGRDVDCNPVFMSYLLIEPEEAVLFIQEKALTQEVKNHLNDAGVSVRDYKDFYPVCEEKKKEGKVFLADKRRVNYRTFNIIKDGETVIKEKMWVKEYANSEITEMDAASFVDAQRKKISDFYDLSFPTISAYGANAAMMHYSATPENNALIKDKGMLLVDSGGQYLRGTTDVTRTFAVGEVTDEMKKAFTLTLKGMLSLSDTVFLEGCSGYSLDILARGALWKEGIDYRCGTGHGVGFMLNVHEGPNAFRWKYVPGVSEIAQLQPGMITTDEPGVYEEGKYGIRLENELLCEKAFENEYGTFLRFRTLTLAPVDLDLVDTWYMNEDDLERLNNYHKTVREELMPLMSDDRERKLLERYTREIGH